jgi:imidazolonepropionase-like amidohydrolase
VKSIVGFVVAAAALVTIGSTPAAQTPQAGAGGLVTAFVNASVITAAGPDAFEVRALMLVVRDGKVERVEPAGSLVPKGAQVVDLGGQFVVPGFVDAHAHVSDVNGLKQREYTLTNAKRQLGVYARYGITTVFSLGGEQPPAFQLRETQTEPGLDRARIFVAGAVIAGATPDAARQAVGQVAAQRADIIKIRVDDNLGSTTKMAPEVYGAVIEEAHKRGLRVAAHIFYLDDAKALLKAGADYIAHSVRDRELDNETIALLKERNAPYCPTLTREVSTFMFESTPDFFSDPFFTHEADQDVVAQLRQPARQRAMAMSATAQRYKAGLAVAMKNLKKASDAGVRIAMGTDSGAAPERFQGYFEHLEMRMMAEAGLTPAEVLRASTVEAARTIGRNDVGALAAGRWADFVVLRENPLLDIRNTQSITSVWIAGVKVPGL